MDWLDEVKWDAHGLVPVIAQEVGSNDVLMFAFMNREALRADRRARRGGVLEPLAQRLWHKGEESGHVQKVHEMRLDCDNDVRAAEGDAARPRARHRLPHRPPFAASSSACDDGRWQAVEPVLKDPEHDLQMSHDQRRHPGPPGRRDRVRASGGDPDKSYVARLFAKGTDAILKKIGEEATEVGDGGQGRRPRRRSSYEVADLWFHSMLALSAFGLKPADVLAELRAARGPVGAGGVCGAQGARRERKTEHERRDRRSDHRRTLDPNATARCSTIGHISYVLHAIVAVSAVLPGVQASVLLLLVAFILDLVKKGDAAGTWQESHFPGASAPCCGPVACTWSPRRCGCCCSCRAGSPGP